MVFFVDVSGIGKHVPELMAFQLFDDLVGILGVGPLHGFDELQGGGVIGRRKPVWRRFHFLLESFHVGLCAGVFRLPVPRYGGIVPFVHVHACGMDVGRKHEGMENRHFLFKAEFIGGLGGVDRIRSGV